MGLRARKDWARYERGRVGRGGMPWSPDSRRLRRGAVAGRRAWGARGGPGATCGRLPRVRGARTGQCGGRRAGGGGLQERQEDRAATAGSPGRRGSPPGGCCGAQHGQRRGPQWAPQPGRSAHGALQQLHLAAGPLGGTAPRPAVPPPDPRRPPEPDPGSEKGIPGCAAEPAAARTHRSVVPPPAPGQRAQLHGPAAPRPPGAPARTTPHAAARATPPPAGPQPRPRPLPAGGAARARGRLRGGLHQSGPSARAASPRLASASANGEPAGARSVGAEGRGIAEAAAVALGPPPPLGRSESFAVREGRQAAA